MSLLHGDDDDDAQMNWALQMSQHTPEPQMNISNIPDDDAQMSWALQMSQNKPESRSGMSDLLSVLSPEEEMEMALRLSSREKSCAGLSPTRLSHPLQVVKRQKRKDPGVTMQPLGKPRHVVIDGMNVGMAHGLHRKFSVQGLVLAYEYFTERSNPVAIFLPRKRWAMGSEQDKILLTALEQAEILFMVPSMSYDDRFIIKYADNKNGIILSNDRYRDVLEENPEFSDQILKRTLQFTWVGDTLMIADDPLGREGPTLQELLQH